MPILITWSIVHEMYNTGNTWALIKMQDPGCTRTYLIMICILTGLLGDGWHHIRVCHIQMEMISARASWTRTQSWAQLTTLKAGKSRVPCYPERRHKFLLNIDKQHLGYSSFPRSTTSLPLTSWPEITGRMECEEETGDFKMVESAQTGNSRMFVEGWNPG